MTSLDIGVDLDGCVYQFTAALRAWVHLTRGTPFDRLPDPVTWTGYVDQWGLSTSEFLDCYREAIRGGVMFRIGVPYPGAVAALQELHASGHRLHIVTDRLLPGVEDIAKQSTLEWLAANKAPYDSITFSSDKTAATMDLFLEDRVENYLAIAKTGGFPVMMDRPYNAALPARRVADWPAFVSLANARALELEAS